MSDSFEKAIEDFFNKFDVDRDGHITTSELVQMMELLRKEAGLTDSSFQAPEKAANLVLKALDSNENDTIELNEFVAWVRKGISLTTQKRVKFAKSAPERADLVMFIDAIERSIPQAAIEHAVNRMFEDYDIDGNGHIDLDELTAMIVELGTIHNRGLPSIDATRDSAKLAMKALDTDTNGTVEKEEFVEWIKKGLTMSVGQREAFAKKGSDRKGLVYFLEACELELKKIATSKQTGNDNSTKVEPINPHGRVAEESPAVGQKAGREQQYQRLLHAIFMNYDNDGDLYINLDELIVLLHDTITRYSNDPKDKKFSKEQLKEPAKQVMDILDSDKNGKLDEDEFVNWVNEGMTMAEGKRNAFGRKSPARALLVRFLECIEIWMEELRPVESAVHKIFQDYDLDEDGHITEAELQAMMTEITGEMGDHQASIVASSKIMKIFDADGNGLLEEDEFYAWVRKGTELSGDERKAFGASSDAKQRMVQLLNQIEQMAKNKDLDPVKLAIRNLFQKYDVDGDGHIDIDEFAAMMTEIMMSTDQLEGTDIVADHQKSVQCADKVMKMLDTNQNNTLEEDEFMGWIEKGRGMSDKARAKFRKKNAVNEHMIRFLASVEKTIGLEPPKLAPKGDEVRQAN
jgi:Ca2+-binding EF-hand superfamily protein